MQKLQGNEAKNSLPTGLDSQRQSVESTFTPGPWRYGLMPEDAQGRELRESPRSGDKYFVAPIKGHSDICEVHHTYKNGNKSTSEANARLIAASPALYAALKAQKRVNSHCWCLTWTGGEHETECDMARAALALVDNPST